MFSIARQYGITVSQLKDWNRLTSNDLKPEQEIFVSAPSSSITVVDTRTPISQSTETPKEVVPVPETKNSNSIIVPVTPVVIGTDEVRESGMAALLDNTDGNRKYLAHHRTIRPGTIVRVKNNLTRKEVFVRVIGNLPNNESPDVLLRLSKSAYDKLGGDGKFSVEVTYFK